MKHIKRWLNGSAILMMVIITSWGLAQLIMWFADWKWNKFVIGIVAGVFFSYCCGWVYEQYKKSRQ